MSYTKKEHLLKRIEASPLFKNFGEDGLFIKDFVTELVQQMPEADVVAVVRCNDCKWWECREDRYGIGKCQNPLNGLFSEYSDNEDYCSYGERREQNEG